MEYVTLGRTNLMVSRSALGTRLLEDVSLEDSIENLNTAFKGGINFWDTLSAYSSVEEKIGKTISKRKIRKNYEWSCILVNVPHFTDVTHKDLLRII